MPRAPSSAGTRASKKNKVLVIGLGNILFGDEGVGVHAAQILKERYRFTPSIDVVDGGTLGLDLVPVLEDHTHVLAIDAVDADLKPGQIGQWNNEEIPSALRTKFSVHQVGFVDLLLITKWRERNPSEICLIGIQPESLVMGLELSDRIQKRMKRLIAVIIEKLKEWKVRCVSRSP